MHPSGEDHRVTAIYLIDDEGHIVEEIFIMPDEDPVAEFDISGLESFEIRASCSQHGLWGSQLINIEEYQKEHPEEEDEDFEI
jgi:desulfoferrodoxin (superoxide reductase-like protein)